MQEEMTVDRTTIPQNIRLTGCVIVPVGGSSMMIGRVTGEANLCRPNPSQIAYAEYASSLLQDVDGRMACDTATPCGPCTATGEANLCRPNPSQIAYAKYASTLLQQGNVIAQRCMDCGTCVTRRHGYCTACAMRLKVCSPRIKTSQFHVRPSPYPSQEEAVRRARLHSSNGSKRVKVWTPASLLTGEPVLTQSRLSEVPAIHWTAVNKIPQRLTILPPPLQLPSNPSGRKSSESGEGRQVEEPKEIFTLPECDPARAKEQSARRLPSLSEVYPRDNAEVWGSPTNSNGYEPIDHCQLGICSSQVPTLQRIIMAPHTPTNP
ncbi:hypothetical protein BT69DRAFT_1280998, partial [Atractiella rhizophila]